MSTDTHDNMYSAIASLIHTTYGQFPVKKECGDAFIFTITYKCFKCFSLKSLKY